MRSYFAAAILSLAAARPAAAEDAIKVVLSQQRDWLHVAIVNVSKQKLQVNAAIGSGGGGSAVEFEVRDGQRRLRDFTSKAGGGPQDQVDLPPGHRIAKKTSFDELALSYDLEAGTYEVTAVYRNWSSDFHDRGTNRSNTIPITVEGDRDFHTMRMKQRGELFDIDLSPLKK